MRSWTFGSAPCWRSGGTRAGWGSGRTPASIRLRWCAFCANPFLSPGCGFPLRDQQAVQGLSRESRSQVPSLCHGRAHVTKATMPREPGRGRRGVVGGDGERGEKRRRGGSLDPGGSCTPDPAPWRCLGSRPQPRRGWEGSPGSGLLARSEKAPPPAGRTAREPPGPGAPGSGYGKTGSSESRVTGCSVTRAAARRGQHLSRPGLHMVPLQEAFPPHRACSSLSSRAHRNSTRAGHGGCTL